MSLKYINSNGQETVIAGMSGAQASDIPTKTSQLENDSGFVTSSAIPTKTSQLTNDSGFVTSSSATFVTQTHSLTASGLSPGQGWNRTTTLTKAGYVPLTTASLLYGPSEDGFEYAFIRFTARASGTCTVEWYCKNAYNGSKPSVTVKLDIIWIKE